MRLGIINLIRSSRESIEFAKALEAGGFWGMGLGDTVPKRYQDPYATAGACFAATEKLHIGPTVTNTVSRHWSVLGATARTFNELYPNRFFAGVATGDGALHSVGLHPAKWNRLEEDVANAATYSPDHFEVQIAASGPRGADAAGRVASDFVIGTGLDVAALRILGDRAKAARAAAGVTAPLRLWAFVNTYVAKDRDEAFTARVNQRGRAVGNARFSFSANYDQKAVPEKWHAIMKERLAKYDFNYHGVGVGNKNAELFEDLPEIQDYLSDRFQLCGTGDEVIARLKQVRDDAGLDGVWFTMTPITDGEDVIARVRAAGDVFRSMGEN